MRGPDKEKGVFAKGGAVVAFAPEQNAF